MSAWLIILIYCIMAYGFSNMMVFGSGPFRIFERIRNLASSVSEHFGSLFSCMMCFPANLGWIMSLVDWFLVTGVAFTPFNLLFAGTNLWWLAMLFDCCFTSGIVWIINHIDAFFESIGEGEGDKDDNNDTIVLHD